MKRVVRVCCDGVEYVLNDAHRGLLVEPYVYREAFDFSDGAVLLIVSSEKYDEDDYIRG